jgi:hypothetical protein
MELFSQRKGIKPVKSIMQVDSVDDDLRTGLWNAMQICYWDRLHEVAGLRLLFLEGNEPVRDLCRAIWDGYFKKPIDTIANDWGITGRIIKQYFFNCTWYEVYDFVEYVANNYGFDTVNQEFMALCNSILERELSAYRFVGRKITQLTSEEEIAEIEKALQVPLMPIQEHLNCSLSLLADRQNPDYRNSIKEAISAVESMCRIITKDESATLGQALGKVETKVRLHPALKSAFSKLYGYTSDEGGIRHALMDQPNISFEDARFMLVSCSAFINYLMERSSKAGIQL